MFRPIDDNANQEQIGNIFIFYQNKFIFHHFCKTVHGTIFFYVEIYRIFYEIQSRRVLLNRCDRMNQSNS